MFTDTLTTHGLIITKGTFNNIGILVDYNTLYSLGLNLFDRRVKPPRVYLFAADTLNEHGLLTSPDTFNSLGL